MEILSEQIKKDYQGVVTENPKIYGYFAERASRGLLTRDENKESHFCVYFLPYNRETKQVFIIHHKKSGLWISPGGHIDKGEDLLTSLNREIKEELGMEKFFVKLPKPFLLSITPIDNLTQPCKEHLDIWFLMETDGKKFNIDPKEFHQSKWLPIKEVKKLVIDPANILAINTLV